jgi:hypothetical protein
MIKNTFTHRSKDQTLNAPQFSRVHIIIDDMSMQF